MIAYLIIQIILPLRHWFIKDDVLWTEEATQIGMENDVTSQDRY